MRYYIIAGEASGDLHGSNLIKGLLAEDPEAQFRFWGGDFMGEAVGNSGSMVKDYAEGAVMGISDTLRKASVLKANLDFCKKDILNWWPDVVILIDYPGFNMKISKFCHKHGIRNFYYIAPKTWASRSWRNRSIRKYVDKLYIVFPFEKAYFDKVGIDYVYEGNPLVEAVDCAALTRPCANPYIAILAGSRIGEISRMMPVCMDVVRNLSSLEQYRNYSFVVAGAPSRSMADYAPYLEGMDNVRVEFGNTQSIVKYAEAAIVNSGTASLEAALIGTPQVVCWSTTPFTAFVGRKILRVMDHIKYISLANLILDKGIFTELIQEDFTAEKVTAEVRSLVEDLPRRILMKQDYFAVRKALGGVGTSRRVAAAMISELSECKR